LKASPKWRFPFISAVLLCLCLVSPLVRRGPSPQGSLCEDCLLQLVAVCCGAAGLLFRQPELLQGLRVLPGDGERIRRPGQSGRDGVRLPGRRPRSPSGRGRSPRGGGARAPPGSSRPWRTPRAPTRPAPGSWGGRGGRGSTGAPDDR
jgi:hypothetical protein